MELSIRSVRTPLMLALLLAGALLLPISLPAQMPAAASQTAPDFRHALLGDWVGVLEYRDYSEPPTSAKRVQLPTWLAITAAGTHLTRHFIYDDGPNKTVDSTDDLAIDTAASSYIETPAGKPTQTYMVSGYAALKSGRGDLTLIGPGTENGAPVQIRIALSIRRNLLTWTEESRPAGSTENFAFRHAYRFTRAQVPAVAPPPA